MAGDNPAIKAPLAGRTLKGKWRLEKQLGTGGMASVWSAKHRNGKRVAIKLLHPELVRDEHVRHRFLREGLLANKVKHPGVVTILDDDDDGELVFLVMELLEGETLTERWKKNDRRLGLRFVLRVADEVLDVLAVAHDEGVIHRDIKPANLFLTTDDKIKVLDFGIARLREGPAGTGHTTRLGATLGSPSFMSPEQARARWEFVDARTDLWAMGAVMFSLLSGKNVHEGKTSTEVLIATATQTPRSLQTVWPEAPDVVAAIVDRALAFERTDRWQDARAMQAAVRRALQIDFDRPRTPMASLPDASMIAPPPSAGKATEVAFIGLPATQSSSVGDEGSAPEIHVRESALSTLDRAGPSSLPPPSASPSSAPPSSAPPSSAPPSSESTTSTPVAAPLEPQVPTLPAPPYRSLRSTVVLGAFIAGGLVIGGVAFGLVSRRPVATVEPPRPAVTVAEPARPSAEPAPEAPAPTVAAAATAASSAAPAATSSAAEAPASSAPATPTASSDAPSKKSTPKTRARPSKGGGHYVPKGL